MISGCGEFATDLLAKGQIDELRFWVHPALGGAGERPFGDELIRLQLIDSKTFDTGVTLLRHQGLLTLERAKTEIRARQMPARPLFDGALQAFAALMMILPGFISDIIGLALFVPALREAGSEREAKRRRRRTQPGGRPGRRWRLSLGRSGGADTRICEDRR